MLRLSLRELLLLVAVVALAIVSLRFASEIWLAIVAGVTMLLFLVMLIKAVVDRGHRQAFAIGFALAMVGYWLILATGAKSRANAGSMNIEFDPYQGRLPTTLLLRYVFAGVVHGRYFDFTTGKELPNFDPVKNQTMFGRVSYRELPPREYFMPIGHCWWGLLLGYLGGVLALHVYSRRINEQSSLASQPS